MIDFDTFTKIAKECGRFGQIYCCQRLQKLAQSPINRQIWSHCSVGRVVASDIAGHKLFHLLSSREDIIEGTSFLPFAKDIVMKIV